MHFEAEQVIFREIDELDHCTRCVPRNKRAERNLAGFFINLDGRVAEVKEDFAVAIPLTERHLDVVVVVALPSDTFNLC